MKKTVFIKNALILTASSLILRFVGIIFKVWLAKIIGSEGIGLYQLVFSVYVLASTFAISGISTAVTRLIAEELALGSKKGCFKILRRAIALTLIIAFVSVLILFFGAEFIAKKFLGDIRALPALKILPLSLPFIGVTSCIRGYFIARRKASPNALSQIFEQAVRILIIAFLINKFIDKGLPFSCFAVILGDGAAEILSCLALGLFYLADRKNLNGLSGRKHPPFSIIKQILHISVPITSGRYLNTLLRTAENLLVPKNLAKFKGSGDKALSQFGMIKGMALPILFFPSAMLNSISTLLIPEISEATALNQKGIVRTATANILKITSLIGFLFGSIFFVCGKEIGFLIYNDADVGFLLKALSPIVPLMYLDSISDGILKGLDQQSFTFRTSIADSLSRIALILIMLPKMGLWGFIIIMYFSNLLTCLLNVGRLSKVSEARLQFKNEIFFPLCLSLISTLLCDTLLFKLKHLSVLFYVLFLCLFSSVLYLIMLFFFKILKKENFLRPKPYK